MSTADDTDESLPIPQRFLDEAARPGAEDRLRKRLPQKLRRIVDSRVVSLAREAYGYVTHPSVSRRTKLLGAGALLYLISPLDAVPDLIPGLGYVDDAAMLMAFVMSVREGAKQVVSHAQRAVEQVTSHAISEARVRRDLLYTGARTMVFDAPSDTVPQDPFFWACLAVGALGLVYQLVFGYRVWNRYASAPPEVKEPLAYAIVSLADWRQAFSLALPVVVLGAVLALRVAWAAQG